MAMVLVIVLALVPIVKVLADNVTNDVVADASLTPSKQITLIAGNVSSYDDVYFYVQPTGGDGDAQCNFDTSTESMTFTINTPTGVNADPATLSFTKCKDGGVFNSKMVRFSAAANAISGNVTFSILENNSGGSFDFDQATFYVNVTSPNTPPSLSVSDITTEGNTLGGANVTYEVSAADDEDSQAPIPSCIPDSGLFFALGNTTVNCSVTDSGGLSSQASFIVTVTDTTPPVIFGTPSNSSKEATSSSCAVVDFSVPTATDLVAGAVSVNCVPASGSIFPLGSNTVTCTAADPSENSASTSFVVTVADTTPPTIGDNADMSVEASGPAGAVVNFAEPEASDLVDPVPAVVCAPASGSTFPLGANTVTCTATDASGNAASSTFDVAVVDTTPPTIADNADITAEASGPSGAAITFDVPAANDLVDTDPTVTCEPESGSTFALGATIVTCTAVDDSGNDASSDFTVTVVDTTPPAISGMPVDATVEATGPTGAALTYTAPTAFDLVDEAVGVTCIPVSGSTFALGATSVVCTASDSRGNTASSSLTVTVVDTTPPALYLPANMTVYATGFSSAVVTFEATADDLVNGPVAVTCSPASGATFAVGTTSVNCSASDTHSNTATGSFTVTVTYNWNGFFRPVDNLPTLNQVKAGSAIPVKFSLGGNQGLGIFAANYPGSNGIACDSTASLDVVEETVTAGGSSLTYDLVANQYVYVWKTDKAWAGTCRQLVVKLADGTYHRANFKLMK